jgi:N-acetylglucosaminyldiphosphoundecaprenol N-acetyl-beta-D-mannosaminyltransferase
MSFSLFGQRYFEGSLDGAAGWVLGQQGRSRVVCVSNVHTAMQSLWDPRLRQANDAADLKVPDGKPLSVLARLKGVRGAQQVRGADLLLAVAKKGLKKKTRHYFYGSAPGVAEAASRRLKARVPGVAVLGAESPPFRALSPTEERALIARLKKLKIGVLWVGLGAPKQEQWMAAMRGRIPAVMVGVGAAFDFYAGTVSEAPRWLQGLGLEWLYRLAKEPGRLWKRYLLTNSLFLILAPFELLGWWRESGSGA